MYAEQQLKLKNALSESILNLKFNVDRLHLVLGQAPHADDVLNQGTLALAAASFMHDSCSMKMSIEELKEGVARLNEVDLINKQINDYFESLVSDLLEAPAQ